MNVREGLLGGAPGENGSAGEVGWDGGRGADVGEREDDARYLDGERDARCKVQRWEEKQEHCERGEGRLDGPLRVCADEVIGAALASGW
jgi:hypothetical protein